MLREFLVAGEISRGLCSGEQMVLFDRDCIGSGELRNVLCAGHFGPVGHILVFEFARVVLCVSLLLYRSR